LPSRRAATEKFFQNCRLAFKAVLGRLTMQDRGNAVL
jgi:hypothetical protein